MIAVLGLIALLSVLMVSFIGEAVERIRYNGLLDRTNDLRERAYSGLETALAGIAQTAEIDDGLRSQAQGWGEPLQYAALTLFDDCTLDITCQDESALLPLAIMSEEQLVTLFEELDIPSGDAERMAIALLDWMDPNDTARINGMDGEDYEREPAPCVPSNAVPRSWEEFLLIRGFADYFRNSDGTPSEAFDLFRQSVSLHNESGVNINNASPFVIQVLSEICDFDEVQLLRELEGDDRQRGTMDDEIFDDETGIDAQGDTDLLSYKAQLLRVRVVALRGEARFSLDALVQHNSGTRSTSGGALSTSSLKDDYKDFPSAPESALAYPFKIVQISEN